MLELIISGGQTGVDQAAWRTAKAVGLATGGWMPKGFLTEGGPRTEFKELYNAKEMERADYPPRTRKNARESDGTLVVTSPGVSPTSPGTRLTISICEGNWIPYLIADPVEDQVERAAGWIVLKGFISLNVAGPRESSSPGIGEAAERWLTQVFKRVLELQG